MFFWVKGAKISSAPFEGRLCVIVSGVRTMSTDSDKVKYFQTLMIRTLDYIINRVPSDRENQKMA